MLREHGVDAARPIVSGCVDPKYEILKLQLAYVNRVTKYKSSAKEQFEGENECWSKLKAVIKQHIKGRTR